MSQINLIRPEKVSLVGHPTLTEKWVEEIIANDPSILGLGDLVLKDQQRIQPRAGRLDLLLQDVDSETRYEVEVQLGKTDESHIIRTIEYWDIERSRYPAYDHVAVIIAEDITTRFLNVISLLNRSVPLIAIQMNAYRNGNDYWLTFTKVLSELQPERDETDEVKEVTDRSYWIKRGTLETVALVDKMLKVVTEIVPGYELKYNKFYIGLSKNGRPDNFVAFRPRKHNLHIEMKSNRSEEVENLIEKGELDLVKFDPQWNAYSFRMEESNLSKHKDEIFRLMEIASKERGID